MQFGRSIAEIKLYLDVCYISSYEAMQHLYLFNIQKHIPTVVCLQVHLSNEQPIIYRAEEHPDIQAILAKYTGHDTTLTVQFKTNEAGNNDIRNTLYQNFPSKIVWNRGSYKWTIRKERFAIGRMYYVHPTVGKRFYLCILLTKVKGATSQIDFCSFEGVLLHFDPTPTFSHTSLSIYTPFYKTPNIQDCITIVSDFSNTIPTHPFDILPHLTPKPFNLAFLL